MVKIIEKEFNALTGAETIIERDETAEEIALRVAKEEQLKKLKEQNKIKAEAKAALLERLGITEEEAKLLLG